ncbi:MAG: NAD-dependent epimerase/dehydratase family protein [Actinomycetota bacterium]
MKSLVTGGAGFIGSHLVEALVARGDDVTVVDDLRNSNIENLSSIIDRVAFEDSDLLSMDLQMFLKEHSFDAIFHLAGTAYVPPSVEDPIYDFRAVAEATLKVLDAARRCSPSSKIIYTSSAAIYGDPATLPIHEGLPPAPVSPYGLHKYAAEQEARLFAELYGMRTASARLFSVYGPRQRKQVIFDLIRKTIASPDCIEAFGDGTQVRDFIFVTDVVSALLCISENGPMNGEVYNVASGSEVTTAQLVDLVAAALGLHPRVAWSGSVRPGDPHRWIASIERLRSIGFEPATSLAEGVARTVEWARHVQ